MSESNHAPDSAGAGNAADGSKRQQTVRRARIVTVVVLVLLAVGAGRTVMSRMSNANVLEARTVEAAKLYESGVASAEDIDVACKLGFGHAMGPLATADLTGVDILMHATSNIYTETQDEKFAPPELMRRMVDAGDIGRKSGQGFYTY